MLSASFLVEKTSGEMQGRILIAHLDFVKSYSVPGMGVIIRIGRRGSPFKRPNDRLILKSFAS